jgi:phage protein D
MNFTHSCPDFDSLIVLPKGKSHSTALLTLPQHNLWSSRWKEIWRKKFKEVQKTFWKPVEARTSGNEHGSREVG